jgi:hypothetical protein
MPSDWENEQMGVMVNEALVFSGSNAIGFYTAHGLYYPFAETTITVQPTGPC